MQPQSVRRRGHIDLDQQLGKDGGRRGCRFVGDRPHLAQFTCRIDAGLCIPRAAESGCARWPRSASRGAFPQACIPPRNHRAPHPRGHALPSSGSLRQAWRELDDRQITSGAANENGRALRKSARRLRRAKFREEERSTVGTQFRASDDSVFSPRSNSGIVSNSRPLCHFSIDAQIPSDLCD